MSRLGSSRRLGKITVLVAVCGWCLSAQAKYSGGSGTEADPFRISAVSDWQELMATPADWARQFVLTADLDLEGIPLSRIGVSYYASFTGVFDGNDHILRNVDVNMPGAYGVGLFGYLGTDGQIKNLGVENTSIFGWKALGGLVGSNYKGSISNCYATGSVTCVGLVGFGGLVGENFGAVSNCYSNCSVSGNARSVGGLVGWNSGAISNCYSSGSVSGEMYVGGLVGQNAGTISSCYAGGSVTGGDNSWHLGGLAGQNSGTISNCCASGSVSGGSGLGGLVGSNDSGTINNCYASGSVTGGGGVGGLVGSNNSGIINNCYASGSVTGGGLGGLGGLVGLNEGTIGKCYSTGSVTCTGSGTAVGGLVGLNAATVRDCYSTSSVTGTAGSYVGGLVGGNYSGTISNCYSAGSVSGDWYVGGLVGHSPGTISNCYFLDTAGPDNGYGTPLTDAQMKQQGSFVGWDFWGEIINGTEDIWMMAPGGYPGLVVTPVEVGGVGDLVVTSVSTEGSGVGGRPVHVEWEVLNDYTEEKISPGFLDAVYLSSDSKWDIGDVLLAIIQHNESVEPQTGYHAETDVILPGVLPGPYYVLVRTDFGNLVYEPDGEYNNICATDADIVVDVEELIIGTPADSNFVHPELSRYFRVTAPAGEDVEIRLDDLDDAGSNELYVSFARIPTRSQFDYRYEGSFASDQTVCIPGTRSGTYYILAYGSNPGGSSQAAFTIGVHFMPLEITEISPARGGNAGTVTATIQGARFKSSTTTKLIGPDGTTITGELHKLSSTVEMIVAFDLRGAAVDTYDVEVKNAEDEVFVMENALEVVEASLPEIQVSLITPSVVRAGSNGTFYVEVCNPRLNDAIWPTIWIGLPDGMKAWLDRDLPVEQSEEIRIDPPCSLVAPSVLPPGTSVRLPVCFRPGEPNGNASISLEVFYSESVLTEPMSVVGNTSAPAGLSGDFFGSYKTPDGKVSCSVSGTYEMVGWPSGWFQQLLQDEFGSLQGWDYNEVALPFWGLTGPSLTAIANASKLGASIRVLEPYAWIQTVKVSAEPSAEPNSFEKQLYIGCVLPANQLPVEIVDPIYGCTTDPAHDTLPFYYTGSGFGSFSDDPGFPTQGLVDLLDKFGMRGADGKRRARIQFEFETHPSEWDGKKDSYPEVVDLGSLGLAWDLKIMMSQEPDKQEIKPLPVVRSWDPNKKVGPAGFGGRGLVLPAQLMVYTVYFENEPNASAAALEVRIEDQLDEDLDWTTFELLEIGFGEYQIPVPSAMSHYETRLDVNGWTWSEEEGWHTGETPLMADVSADIDISTGKVTWKMTSYDPNTGWEPEDAYAGFLPPDDANDITHRGEGYVSFAIRPKANLPAGTLITNSARIFFDQNPAIETPATSNIVTIDLADLDLSGKIDFGDIARLAGEWLWVGLAGTVDEDIVVDGSVNFLDYGKVAEKWLSP